MYCTGATAKKLGSKHCTMHCQEFSLAFSGVANWLKKNLENAQGLCNMHPCGARCTLSLPFAGMCLLPGFLYRITACKHSTHSNYAFKTRAFKTRAFKTRAFKTRAFKTRAFKTCAFKTCFNTSRNAPGSTSIRVAFQFAHRSFSARVVLTCASPFLLMRFSLNILIQAHSHACSFVGLAIYLTFCSHYTSARGGGI